MNEIKEHGYKTGFLEGIILVALAVIVICSPVLAFRRGYAQGRGWIGKDVTKNG